MLRAFIGLAAIAFPVAVQAQDWATLDVCTVESAEIVESAFAPSTFEALDANGATLENGKGRLWRIETREGAVSHLWGTMHSSDPLILDLPQALRDVIAAASVVAVEIDFTAKSRAELRDAPFYAARFKEAGDPFSAPVAGNSIAGLSPEHTDWLRDRAIELGWTEDVELILSNAGMAEMLLSDPCEDFSNGVLPAQDDYIQLLGRLAGAEILGLEGANVFLDDLADPVRAEIAEAIIQVYTAYLKPVSSNAERTTSFALYRQGRMDVISAWDAVYLESVLGEGAARALALTDAYLVAERNDRFLARSTDGIREGGLVMAVGFAHLPGQSGLIERLRAMGHTVTRVVLPGEVE
ncbi:MAG: TraB/GumN family protein [Paracoccaceae bacterium]